MLYLRTVAVGLILSAIFLVFGAVDFAQLAINGHMPSSLSLAFGRVAPTFAFFHALGALDAPTASLTGANIFIPAFYILCCLGLGFFVAALFWPPFDCAICHLLAECSDALDKFFENKVFKKTKKAAILSGVLLVAAGLTTQASAAEFVSVLPAQQVGVQRARAETSNEQILFPAGYSEKGVLVQGLRIAKTDPETYPVQIRTAKGDIFQASAKLDSAGQRFQVRLEQVVVKGKTLPVHGFVADESNIMGIEATITDSGVGTPQNIVTFASNTLCQIVITAAIPGE